MREMLQPAVVLAGWTLVMLVWTIATRMPAMKAAGVDIGKLVGGKGSDADGVLDARAQWKAHNYNHLFEQPVLFYAMVIVLATLGVHDFWTRLIAWGYVTFRILHSIWQATVNRVQPRFALFALTSLMLAALVVRAGLAAWDLPVPFTKPAPVETPAAPTPPVPTPPAPTPPAPTPPAPTDAAPTPAPTATATTPAPAGSPTPLHADR